MIWIILLVSLISLFYWYCNKTLNYWERKNVYHEKPIPIFGNFYDVLMRKTHMGEIIKEIHDKLDDEIPYFGFYIFHEPSLVVRTQDAIRDVLVKNFTHFPNRFDYTNEKVDPFSALNLFTMKNDSWRFQRHKVSPAFSSGKIKMMLPLMKEITTDLKEVLKKSVGQQVDIKDLTKRYIVDIISSCAFGINAGSLKNENSEIKIMANRILNNSSFVRSFAVFAWFFCPIIVDIFRLPLVEREASEFLVGIFKMSLEERKNEEIKRNDLIDLLQDLVGEKDDNNLFEFDDMKMAAQAQAFFQAGADTSSSILMYSLYELALNRDVQMKLRTEILENMDPEGDFSYDKLMNLEYLDLVIKEVLRKYPILQILQRYCEKDFTFDTGLTMRAGQRILIPTGALHYDPKFFPNPGKFDPERFRGDKMKDLQFVYLPFGDGPRKCIAARFGLMAVKMGVTNILKTYEVVPGEKTEIPLEFAAGAFFTTPKNASIYLKIQKAE